MKRDSFHAVRKCHFRKVINRVKDSTGARRDYVESEITEMS